MKALQKLEKWVFLIDSGIPWPILSLIWGIHGNEPCGIELLQFCEKYLTLKKWKLFLIYWNLSAIKKQVRQCDVNLNRIFRNENELSKYEKMSSEYKDMQRIKKYLDMSDAALDIHSSPTPWSPVFAICEESCFSIVQYFKIRYLCFWFSQVEPGGTDYYMYLQEKPWICIECWYHNDEKALWVAKETMFEFLRHYEMYDGNSSIKKQESTKLKAVRVYITKTKDFSLVRDYNDFEKIQAWDIIAKDGEKEIYSQNDWCIIFARDRKQVWVEGFIELTQNY